MGRIARDHALGKQRGPGGLFTGDEPRPDGPSQTQSEVSIAVDSTGQHIVIGFNDFRGLSTPAVSLSGFSYSDDGGTTFIDGGQLPTPANDILFGERFPQIFGDPDVKYVGGCTFVYTSIALFKYGAGGIVQGLSVHRSTDCGHTWTGPFAVTSSLNPSGLVDVNGIAIDAADKELMDVDPDTGRVSICWTNFGAVAVEISCTFSDNTASGTPIFSPRAVIAASAVDGQGSMVRFAGNGSPNAYIAWSRFPSGYLNNIGFARSTDNGVTWSAPINITTNFVTMDYVLGNDRVNNNPSIAVDTSPGPFKGNVYVVYSTNNSLDGGDVAFQRSSDGGVTFSAPVLLNSRPGADRAQWFPYVTVDKTTGRVSLIYYDQGIASSGDLTEVTTTYSDDGGTTWSRPVPISDQPFKAGWGNDTGQPNLGDYIGSTAQAAALFATYATTAPVGFTDGQPSTSMTVPDVAFKRIPNTTLKSALRLGTVTFTESGGNGTIDPGDTVDLTLPLANYVTNPLTSGTISGIAATLSIATPGISVSAATSSYPVIAPAASAANITSYRFQVPTNFVAGTPIDLTLSVATTQGSTVLLYRLATGTPNATPLLSQNFESVSPGALPAGWTSVHGAGANTVPWRTSNTFSGCGSSNAAFHPNANDGPAGGSPSRWERLLSPLVSVPANAQYVTLEFDVCYDTEDDPVLARVGYDGFFLRIADQTAGSTLRSVLVEAFEEEFTTGALQHYPKHLPRNSDSAYFEDMSAWAGFSNGVQHVRMKLPGMAGRRVQLRFEYAQDAFGICSDVRPGHSCGVAIDNIVMSGVAYAQAQSMTFNPLPNKTFGDGPFAVNATATSGLPVSFAASGNCTVVGNLVSVGNVGNCTITASQGGNNAFLPAPPISRTFSILPLAVTASITFEPGQPQYSDPVTINATMPVLFGLNPANSVTFVVGSQTLGPVALSVNGGMLTASAASSPLLFAPGNYTVSVSYGGVNANFRLDPLSVPLVVSREDARATYTGPRFASTSSVTSSTAALVLNATVQDITALTASPAYDSTPGDIRKATAKFVDRGAGDAVLCSGPIGLVSAGDLKTGTFSCTWNANIGANNAATYQVGIVVDGYYTRNDPSDDALITVSKPLDEFVAGGGSVNITTSSGLKAADAGTALDFGLNVKFNQSGRNLQGNFTTIFRRTEGGVLHVYQVKANAMNSLASDPVRGVATFEAKASVQDVTNPNAPISIDGNATVQVTMTDRGEPGNQDSIAIMVINKNGGLWFVNKWNGSSPVEETLSGGNLEVK